MEWVLHAHLAAAWFMAGVIWYVQVVHYPSFAWVDRRQFAAFEASHRALTSFVVVPAMLTELFTGLWLLWQHPTHSLLIAELVLLVMIWGTTFLVSVPLHERLSHGYDEAAAKRLVLTNWPRCALWSARAVLVLILVKGTV